ncbi:DUF2721 domain-containing protein [Methylocystis sp.]|uniref:DUF2721 domain-containing protein n=1 Tax=Methylocystis sp. TaxID=1911079 RepID=UPI003DA2D8F4
MITRLAISGYRSIRDLVLAPGQLTVMTGTKELAVTVALDWRARLIGIALYPRARPHAPRPLMLINTPSIEQLSNVISQVTGPAFLLAAEAQLLAVLVSRLERIVDRSRMISQTDGASAEYAHLQAELPILRKRGMLMHYAMYWGVASCIVTCVLVIVSFAAAYLHVRHEYGAGLLFAVAMALFTAALVAFARELQLGYVEIIGGPKPPQRPARKSYPHA